MKGFSLVEILIATCIFIILIMAVFQSMDIGRGLWFTGETSVELRQEIIKAFITMERELKGTRPSQTSLTIASSSPTLSFRTPQDNDGDGTILDSMGNVEWSPQITYALNASHQITRTLSGATTILANDITSLQFTRPTAPVNILQIDITTSKTTSFGRQIQDAGQIIIEMRN